MNVEEKKIVQLTNRMISLLNKETLSKKEITIILAQLMIYCGQSISQCGIDVVDLDVKELYSKFYSSNGEDIGLGFVINGAEIMSTINDETINNNEIVQGELNDNSLSATNEIPQKNSSTSSRSSKTKRRSKR